MIIDQDHEITELFVMFCETMQVLEVETAQFFGDIHFQTNFHE